MKLSELAQRVLDSIAYVQHWCAEHGNGDRLQAALDAVPPI